MTRDLDTIQAELKCNFNEKLYLTIIDRDITVNTNTLELYLNMDDPFSLLFKLKISLGFQ